MWHGAQVTRLSSECAHLRARAARLREQRDRAEAALAAARAVYDDALANPGRRRSTRENFWAILLTSVKEKGKNFSTASRMASVPMSTSLINFLPTEYKAS